MTHPDTLILNWAPSWLRENSALRENPCETVPEPVVPITAFNFAPATDSVPGPNHANHLAMVPYCGVHNDPRDWEFRTDKYKRPGFRAAHCRHCGRFIGYAPPQRQ